MRARNAIEHQARMLEANLKPRAKAHYRQFAQEYSRSRQLRLDWKMARQLACGILAKAEPYAVTAEMIDLVTTAVEDLPTEPIWPDDLWTDHPGLAILEKPIPLSDAPDANRLSSIAWITGRIQYAGQAKGTFGHAEGDGIYVHAFLAGQPCRDVYMGDLTPWIWGDPWECRSELEADGGTPDDLESNRRWTALGPEPSYQRRWLLAFFRLIKQRIPRIREEPSDAATRKVARDLEHVETLRTITLRRYKTQGAEGDHQPANFQHRFWVRGHWRDQWYPSKRRHEKIWIHPFIKGPEDKPIVHKIDAIEVRR